MRVEIDELSVGKWDVGERILREYEKGEISTRRTYELMSQLFNGRLRWDLDHIWSDQ